MRLVWIGAVLIAVATSALVFLGRPESDDRIAVGTCLDVLEGLAPADTLGYPPAAKIGCDERKAAYKVALLLPGAADCPSPIYILRRENAPAGLLTYCMTFNVGEGECFVQTPAEAGAYNCELGPRPGGIKILSLVEGVADASKCVDIDEPGAVAALIPEPPKTFCYQQYDTGGDAPIRSA